MANKNRKAIKAVTASLAFILYSVVSFNLWAQEPKEEIVYLKPVAAVASSFDSSEWAPPGGAMAIADGDFQTRWSPTLGKDNEWIYVDLGKLKTFTKIIIYWERAYATDYEILVSDDANNWRQIRLMNNQRGGIREIDLTPIKARYVKLMGLKRSNPEWGFSIWEFEIYGPKELNPNDRPITKVFPDRKPPKPVILKMEEPLPSSAMLSQMEFQKGIAYTSYAETDLASEASDAMLEHIKAIGVGHISLVVTWYQDTLESDKMYPEDPQGGRTAVDESLSHAINKIHSLGMKVMLKPHIDLQTGEFRGDIPGSDEWFNNYEKFILKYAKFASEYNVEMFCIGTELGGTPLKWKEKWMKIIKEVRQVYRGPLVYASNWNEYKDVPFWNEIDFVGIDAYFPLSSKNDPTKEELIASWEKIAKEIEKWLDSKGIQKPVIFTEAGYASADGCNKRPWEITSKTEDQREQADCLDALLTVMTKRPWFKGLYWWNYFTQDVETPLGFPIKGKLAEKVLANWYKVKE